MEEVEDPFDVLEPLLPFEVFDVVDRDELLLVDSDAPDLREDSLLPDFVEPLEFWLLFDPFDPPLPPSVPPFDA